MTEMLMCHSEDPQNQDYYLVVTKLQLLRSQTWLAWQTGHTGHEEDHIQHMCSVVIAADAPYWWYDHHNRQTAGTTIF